MAEQTQEPTKPDAGAAGEQTQSAQGDKSFTQADVDRIVQERLNRDRQKFSDYEELRNKVSEYEKHKEQLSQQELEKKQEYDKLKEQWSQKEQQYQSQLNETRQQVQAERVNNTLTTEILKKNAYPEAADLLRSMTKYNEDGTITIRGKDANGMEADLSVEKGVEQFLNERPYLVKGSAQGGAGTSPTGSGGGGEGGGNRNLAQELQNAMAAGDRKKVNELKTEIKAKHASGGFTSII